MLDRSDAVGFLKANNRYAEKIPVTREDKGDREGIPHTHAIP